MVHRTGKMLTEDRKSAAKRKNQTSCLFMVTRISTLAGTLAAVKLASVVGM